MTQILNLLLFLRELVFGRDATSRMTRGQRMRSTIGIGILFISLVLNYYQFKGQYKTTYRNIQLKEKIVELETRIEAERDLAAEVRMLERILSTMTGDFYSGEDLVAQEELGKAPDVTVVIPAQDIGKSNTPKDPLPQPKVIILQPPSVRDESLNDAPKVQ